MGTGVASGAGKSLRQEAVAPSGDEASEEGRDQGEEEHGEVEDAPVLVAEVAGGGADGLGRDIPSDEAEPEPDPEERVEAGDEGQEFPDHGVPSEVPVIDLGDPESHPDRE